LVEKLTRLCYKGSAVREAIVLRTPQLAVIVAVGIVICPGSAATQQSANQASSNSAQRAAAAGPSARLNGHELTDVAALLTKLGLQSYRYLAIGQDRGKDGKLTFEIKREARVTGLLMSRSGSAMKRLGNGLFDDRAGNLVFKGTLSDSAGKKVPYAITNTADGRSILSADRDNDGVVDVLVGSGGGGRPWLMGNRGLEWLLLCFEGAELGGGFGMIAAARLCVPCLDANVEPGAPLTAEERDCINRNRNGRGGRGGGAGLSGSIAGDILSPPNCGPPQRSIDGGIAGVEGDQPRHERMIENHENAAERARQEAERQRRDGNNELADQWEAMADAHDRAAQKHHEAIVRRNEAMAAIGQPNERDLERRADEAADEAFEISRRVLRTEAALWRTTRESRYGPGRPGSTNQPAIGPDGSMPVGFQDPRCGGIGQSSHWSEMCRGTTDVIDCFRRMSDPVYAATRGRCWQETDETDRTVVRCRSVETGGGGAGDDAGGRPSIGGESACPNDAPNCIRGGGGRGDPGRAVDVTPLGGFLAAFCARGGCPDFAPIDRPQR